MRDWHPEDVKAAIRKRGGTLTSVARSAQLGSSALGLALVLPRAEAERAIADFLNVSPMQIWPSRYEATGERKRPQPRENYIPRTRVDTRVLEQVA